MGLRLEMVSDFKALFFVVGNQKQLCPTCGRNLVMKNVGELAICGLNVACKVALIAQSQCFFCPFLLHTYVREQKQKIVSLRLSP